jgi:hypothetical protein
MSLLFRMWMMNYLIINLVLVIRRTKTQHVKETTGVINNKACNNEEDVTFRTGTVHLSFLFSLTTMLPMSFKILHGIIYVCNINTHFSFDVFMQ